MLPDWIKEDLLDYPDIEITNESIKISKDPILNSPYFFCMGVALKSQDEYGVSHFSMFNNGDHEIEDMLDNFDLKNNIDGIIWASLKSKIEKLHQTCNSYRVNVVNQILHLNPREPMIRPAKYVAIIPQESELWMYFSEPKIKLTKSFIGKEDRIVPL